MLICSRSNIESIGFTEFCDQSAEGSYEAGDKKKVWLKATLNDIFIVQAVSLDRKPALPTTPGVSAKIFCHFSIVEPRYDVDKR